MSCASRGSREEPLAGRSSATPGSRPPCRGTPPLGESSLQGKRHNIVIMPPLNKKLIPVYRPGGSKRADWNSFFHLFNNFFFFTPPPLYFLV